MALPSQVEELKSLDPSDPSFQDKVDSALFACVSSPSCSVAAVSLLLDQYHANPTSPQKKGRLGTTNALLVAILSDLTDGSSSKLFSLLISSKKVDINAADNQGNTALHVAAQRGQFGFVSSLLEHGANLKAQNLQLNTPLHQSVSKPQSNSAQEREKASKTMEILLSKSSFEDLLAINKQGDGVLLKAVHQGNFEAAKILLSHLDNLHTKGEFSTEQVCRIVNLSNAKGQTPIHEAAIWGKTDMLSYLIKYRLQSSPETPIFNVSATDLEGNNALHLTGDRRLVGVSGLQSDSSDSLAHVKLLLDAGLQVNSKNNLGNTPLHTPQVSVEFVQLLIAHGADLAAKNTAGDTPLSVNICDSRSHNVQSIIRHLMLAETSNTDTNIVAAIPNLINDHMYEICGKEKKNIIHLLCHVDDDECLRYIHQKNPSAFLSHLKQKDNEDQTPLQLAVEEKSIHALSFLLRKFPSQTEDDFPLITSFRDSQGNSLLHTAAIIDCVEAIDSLIEVAHINVNVENTEMDEFSDGGLPIHCAAMSGSLNALERLVKHGADINSAKNPTRDTPLHLATRFNQMKCVEYLLPIADVQIRNRDGMTPSDEVRALQGIDEEIRTLYFPQN